MKNRIALITLVMISLSLFSCEKCWKCKVWRQEPTATGSAWEYIGEDEFCKTGNLDYSKNDSTDGFECQPFYK